MKTLKIEPADNNTFIVRSKGLRPCFGIISNLQFHDIEPILQMDVQWIEKGRYSNLQRKKLLSRTFLRLLKRIVDNNKLFETISE